MLGLGTCIFLKSGAAIQPIDVLRNNGLAILFDFCRFCNTSIVSLVNQTLLLGDAYRLEIISAPRKTRLFLDHTSKTVVYGVTRI